MIADARSPQEAAYQCFEALNHTKATRLDCVISFLSAMHFHVHQKECRFHSNSNGEAEDLYFRLINRCDKLVSRRNFNDMLISAEIYESLKRKMLEKGDSSYDDLVYALIGMTDSRSPERKMGDSDIHILLRSLSIRKDLDLYIGTMRSRDYVTA